MKSLANTIIINSVKVIIAIVFVISLISCALIVHGTFQDIGINSSPSGAKVLIDNSEYGKTPVIAKLSRKIDHIIAIDLEGYEPYEITLTRKVDSWVIGNIVFGGLIGLAVDAAAGSMYKLTPEQVSAELISQPHSSLLLDDDNIFILVTLNPNKDYNTYK